MLGSIDFFAQASAMARHAAKRHSVITENIANADTPNYKARELPPFDPYAVRRATRGDGTAAERMLRAREIENAEGSPNGNTVSLEEQMARAADAQAQHDTAMAFYRKAMELLRMSMRGPR